MRWNDDSCKKAPNTDKQMRKTVTLTISDVSSLNFTNVIGKWVETFILRHGFAISVSDLIWLLLSPAIFWEIIEICTGIAEASLMSSVVVLVKLVFAFGIEHVCHTETRFTCGRFNSRSFWFCYCHLGEALAGWSLHSNKFTTRLRCRAEQPESHPLGHFGT